MSERREVEVEVNGVVAIMSISDAEGKVWLATALINTELILSDDPRQRATMDDVARKGAINVRSIKFAGSGD